MKAFVIIFVLAILFVVGSAMAMRYFDNATVRGHKKDESEKDKED